MFWDNINASENINKIVFAEVFKQSCSQCKTSAPHYRQAADQINKNYPGKAVFLLADLGECIELKRALGLKSVPTYLVYYNGNQQYMQAKAYDTTE